jgi:DNA invertase Pin-like site-specific DNA recombinase
MSAATGPAAGRMDLGPMREQLQARIDVINAEIVALEAERAELERVLGAMPEPAAAPERAATRRRRERAASGRGRSRRPVSARPTRAGATGGRPTAEQAERLVALLRDGPTGRNDIARALGLSLTRTGQLLDVLGARVASETDPDNPRRKRWRLAEESAAT